MTACSQKTKTEIKIVEVPKIIEKPVEVKQDIPKDLLVCKDFPKKEDYKMQSDVSDLLTDVWNVAEDCKAKLLKIKKLIFY